MARKPGLPKKYAKMGFKKGWRAFKAAMGGRKKGTSTGVKKVAAKTAKKRTIVRVVQAKAPKPRNKRRNTRKMFIFKDPMMDTLAQGGTMAATAIGSTALVEMTPKVQDWPTMGKVAVQAGTGTVVMMAGRKNKIAQVAGMGAIIGAGISALLPWFRKSKFGQGVFAGPKTQFQRNRLGKYNAGNSIRNAGPVDQMAGPWNRLNGPVRTMTNSSNNLGNTNSNFNMKNNGFKTVNSGFMGIN